MSKLTNIKYKIDQLDGGAFQNLCDAYLACLGYKNIYSLGMKSGTDKTAKGNPDTYFLNADGKYIFVMYTTQKPNFFNSLNNKDANLMYSIFGAISELSSERRKKAIIHFITLNPDPELFQRLPLEASHWGGWGSMIPEIEKRITFLSSLLQELSGLKYLQHKQRIEEDIKTWRARIEAEEIEELLRF